MKKNEEENIVNLLKSGNLEDQLLGCRLALEILGNDWCRKYLNRDNFQIHYPGATCYWIIKGNHLILASYNIHYYENYTGTVTLTFYKERGDIIINLNEE